MPAPARKEKGLAPGDRLNYLTETFGFGREHLELAQKIRDTYASMASLTGVAMAELLAIKPEGRAREKEPAFPLTLSGGPDDPGRPTTAHPQPTGASPMPRSRLVPREAIVIRRYPEIEAVVERFFTSDDPRALMLLGRPGIGKDEIFQKCARKHPGLAVDPPLSGLSKPLATFKAGFDNLHRLLVITDGEGLWGTCNGKGWCPVYGTKAG